jgi:very-short-patch-repair endonuclease
MYGDAGAPENSAGQETPSPYPLPSREREKKKPAVSLTPSPPVGEGRGEGGLLKPKARHTTIAKRLRRNTTDAERLLWRHLRAKAFENLKFKRQQPIGDYIVDFVCFEKKLIVEVDGGQHALNEDDDNERAEWLNAQGFKVIRFWNHEALCNIEGVFEVIRNHCLGPDDCLKETPLSISSPTGGEGKK